MKDTKQKTERLELRVEPEVLAMVEDLRRLETPIPPASEIWRRAVKEMHARKMKVRR